MSLLPNPSQNDILSQVSFLNVHRAFDLSALQTDGLLGLAPNAPPDHPYETLVYELYSQKLIERNMFSLYLAHTGAQSKIWFGGFDPSYIRAALKASVAEE
jgi:hypothetical protein